jgi:hypothetical protein
MILLHTAVPLIALIAALCMGVDRTWWVAMTVWLVAQSTQCFYVMR